MANDLHCCEKERKTSSFDRSSTEGNIEQRVCVWVFPPWKTRATITRAVSRWLKCLSTLYLRGTVKCLLGKEDISKGSNNKPRREKDGLRWRTYTLNANDKRSEICSTSEEINMLPKLKDNTPELIHST